MMEEDSRPVNVELESRCKKEQDHSMGAYTLAHTHWEQLSWGSVSCSRARRHPTSGAGDRTNNCEIAGRPLYLLRHCRMVSRRQGAVHETSHWTNKKYALMMALDEKSGDGDWSRVMD
ncbi:hypothetical protein EXN66_Car001896 [Channa argus]|uniref:Uncharacterized protein n=1 Tax=Channa argus TaxID=215402 RepID=A0A6G1P7X0_CHAAH|nr:hypothetical protein EXN66_Car001896 [Channa argus]